jgi:hypothetical protein
VDGILFNVHRFFLQQSSSLCDITPSLRLHNVGTEGGSDEKPVVLPHVKSGDFANFLWVFYNPYVFSPVDPFRTHIIFGSRTYDYSTGTIEQWMSILDLASRWNFKATRDLAIHMLEDLLEPVEKKKLWQIYGINKEWVLPAFVSVCMRQEPLSLQEGRIIGTDTAILMAQAREKYREGGAPGTRILSSYHLGHMTHGRKSGSSKDIAISIIQQIILA